MPPDVSSRGEFPTALFAQLAEQTGDCLLAFDRDLACVYGSNATLRLTGLRKGEWLGRPIATVFPFIDEALLHQTLQTRQTTSQVGTLSTRGTSEPRFFEGQYFPLYGKDGELVGIGAVLRDSTQRKHAEQALRETESRFRNMADASPVLLWMAGPDGLCTFFNQTWLAFTGRTMEDEWGVGWAENVHFEDFEHCMNTYVRAFNRRSVFEMDYRLRRHDGEYRWILDLGTPRYAPDGTFVGYIGSCIDITERRLLEAELRGAVELRDDFLSVASHELGTPLTSLRLLVETLMRALRRQPGEGQSGGTLEVRISAIQDQISRLSGLVDTLLDASHIAEGRLALAPEPVDLSALVRKVVTQMTQVATDAGCAVALQIPGPVHGVWDPVRTEQVVTNVLSNAFKYGAGHPVDIVVAADDAAARLRVRDRGIGIPADKQSIIFERFERAAPKNQYGGFGLGLWITRRALEEMGGTIRVQSAEGAGAAFEIELPRQHA